MRLASALSLSLIVHALLLNWSLPWRIAGGGGGAPGDPARLNVQLRPAAPDTQSPVIEPTGVAAPPPPATAQTEADTAKDAGPVRDAGRSALPLYGYFPAERLTRMPEAEGVFDIAPPVDREPERPGKATLRIWIGARGDIDALRVVDTDLPEKATRNAVDAFTKLRFRPGEIGGVPVQSVVDVVVEYAGTVGEDGPQR